MKVCTWKQVIFVLFCLLLLAGCGGDETTPPATEIPPVSGIEEIPPLGENNGILNVSLPVKKPLPAPLVIAPPTGPNYVIGSTVSHVVEPLEWMHQVARCYGTSYRDVYRANSSIINPNYILPDDVLAVPNVGSVGPITGPNCIRYHAVAPGETFYGLAQMYQTEPIILQKANPGPLLAGDIIIVPSVGPQQMAPPSLRQSLVFNLNGDLAVWRHADAWVDVYVDDAAFILDMVVGENGRFVLVKQTRDQGATVEVALIDRLGNTETVIETNLPPDQMNGSEKFRPSMLISPNGDWAAYLVREDSTMRLSTFATSNPGDVKQLAGIAHGVMEFSTPQLFAGKEDGHFLMLDDTGIYEYPYALDAAENRIVGIVEDDYSKPLLYEAVAWSPASGHLLLQGFYIEGGQYFVLDKNSGALAPLPGSGGYITNTEASWLLNGHVAVISFPGVNEAGPVLTIYRPESSPTALSLIVVSNNVLSIPGYSLAQPGFFISTPPIQSIANVVDFTIVGAGAASGYWMVETSSMSVGRLNHVVSDSYQTYWTTNGTGLLMEQGGYDKPWELVYVPVTGMPAFSLTSWLGIQISHFNWVK